MIGHLVLSLGLGGIATGVLVMGLRFRPRTPVWSIFLLLSLVIWAGGVWVAPAGPVHFGVAWLPFLLIAILLAVLLAAVAPGGGRSHHSELEIKREVEVGLGLFFWILTATLVAVIAAGYR